MVPYFSIDRSNSYQTHFILSIRNALCYTREQLSADNQSSIKPFRYMLAHFAHAALSKFLSFTISSCSSCCPQLGSCSPRLTLSMIPTEMPVNSIAVPPILINGNGCPVTGPSPTTTPIFTIAWQTRSKLNPADRSPPNARSEL